APVCFWVAVARARARDESAQQAAGTDSQRRSAVARGTAAALAQRNEELLPRAAVLARLVRADSVHPVRSFGGGSEVQVRGAVPEGQQHPLRQRSHRAQ